MDAPMILRARPLTVGLLLFFAVLSIQYCAKAVQRDGTQSAIMRWRSQLLEFQDGADIFEKHAYPNPPVMALILLPVVVWPDAVGLPPVAAGIAWFFLKVAMTLLALRWTFQLVETPERPFPLPAKVLTVLLSLRAVTGDLMHGNVNLFILFLIVAGLHALRNRRDVLAGLTISLAMCCKVTPALFVPYLVWKRAWRALGGCAVGVALFFWPGFVPAVFLGWNENLDRVGSWTRSMVKPFVVEGAVTSEHHNQSFPGVVQRLLTDSPSFVVYIDNVWTPDRYHNVASLSPEAARLLVKACMGLFCLLVIWSCRSPLGVGSGPAAEYAVVVLGMLLFSERTWKHHCVTLLLPFAVLSYHVWWSSGAMRRYLIGSLVVSVVLMGTTSISLLGREFGKLAQVYGAYVAAFLVLLAALVVVLRRGDRPASTATVATINPPLAA